VWTLENRKQFAYEYRYRYNFNFIRERGEGGLERFLGTNIVQLGLKLNNKVALNHYLPPTHPTPGTFQRVPGMVGG